MGTSWMALERYALSGTKTAEYVIPKMLELLAPTGTYDGEAIHLPPPSGVNVADELRRYSQLINAAQRFGIPIYCILVNRSGDTEVIQLSGVNI